MRFASLSVRLTRFSLTVAAMLAALAASGLAWLSAVNWAIAVVAP